MKIVSLTGTENKADVLAALFDDGSQLKVSPSQIADYGLYAGREFTDEEYTQLKNDLAQSASKKRALRILGSRTMSAGSMEKRLISKGESKETAQNTVEWLVKTGAIDDAAYATAIVAYYSDRGYGLARIRDELFRRGIGRGMWDEVLSGLDDMEDEAYHYLEQRLNGSIDKDEIRKAINALCRRGFSYSEARAAAARYMEENDL